MDIQSGRTLAINGVTADFGSETLRDKSGASIDLRPQAFAVLRQLAENAGRLVTKDELMQAVWPGVAVTDDSLVQCIHEIRRALRDEEHAVLKTVPKRGYRLVPPAGTDIEPAAATPPFEAGAVSAAPVPVAPRQGPGLATAAFVALLILAAMVPWWLFGRAEKASAPTDGPPVIAVLPFTNLGGDPGQDYFADGITEDLITDLSKLSGVFVIARNSTWTYKGQPVKVEEIAKELGARFVVNGSVRREGDQIRINAQLADAVGGRELWADRYDGTLSNVFALQDKVIGQIVSALAVTLTSAEQAEAGQVETTNPKAYDALLQGLDHLRRDTEKETLAAISSFEKAVALDPHYSRAYAALAAAQWRITLSFWFSSSGAGWQHAYEGLNRNLAKAMEKPTSLAYAILSQVQSQQGLYDEAFATIDRAMALAPSDPDNHVAKARILNATGRAAAAEAEIQVAMRLDPRFSPSTLRVLAISLFNEQKYQEAADTLERVIALQSDVAQDYSTLVSAYGHLGRTEGVQAAIDKYAALAIPAAYDPMTVQESAFDWYGIAFNYHRPYIDQMTEGLRKAGVPEGAGTDLALDDYARFMKRSAGEFEVTGSTRVNAVSAKALRDRGVRFIDVRAPLDFDNGHIPGAVNLSLIVALSKESLAKVAGKDDEATFYCHGKYCPYSAYATAKAVAWGYTRVYYFAGGFPEWQDAGFPVETAPTQ
jgi:TolB-like protein/DNA-binding winged helix-turn-helix (wHTH) protein/rhodanese-related sulfurtransferase